jgi:hypothetical protein
MDDIVIRPNKFGELGVEFNLNGRPWIIEFSKEGWSFNHEDYPQYTHDDFFNDFRELVGGNLKKHTEEDTEK